MNARKRDPRDATQYQRQRSAFFASFGRWGVCAVCGRSIDMAVSGRSKYGRTVDHITPVTAGGSLLDPQNWRLACRSCNSAKGRGDDRGQQGGRDRWKPGTFLRRTGEETKPCSDFEQGEPVATHRVNTNGSVEPLSPNR